MLKNKVVVYTSGTFDMLHINHLNLLDYARGLGDILIVGVNTDELVRTYKSEPIVPFEENCITTCAKSHRYCYTPTLTKPY